MPSRSYWNQTCRSGTAPSPKSGEALISILPDITSILLGDLRVRNQRQAYSGHRRFQRIRAAFRTFPRERGRQRYASSTARRSSCVGGCRNQSIKAQSVVLDVTIADKVDGAVKEAEKKF